MVQLHEFECKRCSERLTLSVDEYKETDSRCVKCGSSALDKVQGTDDALDILRTKSAGGGC